MTETTGAARLSIYPGMSLWFSPIEWLRLLGPLPSHLISDVRSRESAGH